jgi:cytidyltransferase-like protein
MYDLDTIQSLEKIGLSIKSTNVEKTSYKEALNDTKKHFSLLGVGAHKLTKTTEFENLLKRIIETNGTVKLLLLDPSAYSMVLNLPNLKTIKKTELVRSVTHSLKKIELLIERFKCRDNILIRSYQPIRRTDIPPFRLTFVDDEVCLFSPRSFEKKKPLEVQPEIKINKINNSADDGFYGSFRTYYDSLWQNASKESVGTMLEKINILPDSKIKTGCVHGRFQPPHTGHLQYILKAKDRCNFLYIGITQPDIKDLTNCEEKPYRGLIDNNPLTYDERSIAIKKMLAPRNLIEGRDYVIIRYDVDNKEYLKKYINHDWIQYSTRIEKWNVYKNEILLGLGYRVDIVAEEREISNVSGTNIRSLAKNNDQRYKEMVTKEVAAYLEEIDFQKRIT